MLGPHSQVATASWSQEWLSPPGQAAGPRRTTATPPQPLLVSSSLGPSVGCHFPHAGAGAGADNKEKRNLSCTLISVGDDVYEA